MGERGGTPFPHLHFLVQSVPPTSNFQKTQGNAGVRWHLLHFCLLCSELFITLVTLSINKGPKTTNKGPKTANWGPKPKLQFPHLQIYTLTTALKQILQSKRN